MLYSYRRSAGVRHRGRGDPRSSDSPRQRAAAQRNVRIAIAAEAKAARTPAQRAASARNFARARAVALDHRRHHRLTQRARAADLRNLARARAGYRRHRLTQHDITVDIRNLAKGRARYPRNYYRMVRVNGILVGVSRRGRLDIHYKHKYVMGFKKGTMHFKKTYGMGMVNRYWGYKPKPKKPHTGLEIIQVGPHTWRFVTGPRSSHSRRRLYHFHRPHYQRTPRSIRW